MSGKPSSSSGAAPSSSSSSPSLSAAPADAPSDPDTPFVNAGLQRWEKIRAEWKTPRVGSKGSFTASGASGGTRRGEVCAKTIDVEDVIERIFSQSGKGILPEPIPLGQMIDILVDFWESEGLFDVSQGVGVGWG